MNSKTTWGLLALSLALLAYILVFERQSRESAHKIEGAGRLFPNLDPAAVTSIEIRRTNSSVGVERLNDRWQLTKPPYPAQSTGPEEFLRSVAQLQTNACISAQEISKQPNGRAAFGLQPPQVSITLTSGTNQILFDLGARTLSGNELYLQLARDRNHGVFVAEAQILEHLPASANAWRNPMLLRDDRLGFDQIAVTNETSFFEIVRDKTNQLWRLVKPWPARADGNAVDYLVQQLRSARISQFVTDDPAADLEPYGLQTPKVQMTLARGSNVVFQLWLGQSPTNTPSLVYARPVSQTNVVLVPADLADLLRKSHEFFRDRTLISFPPSAVSRIEISARKESFALERQTNGAWQIVEPFQAPADTEIVRTFFTNLARLEIVEFPKDVVEVTDFSAYGLSHPVRKYVLKTAVTNALGVTNPVLAQVEFGTNQVNQPDRIFARRVDETSVYSVSLGDTLRLPQAAFEFRDRRIWHFASSNVVSVTVSQHGRTRKLERNARQEWSPDLVYNAAMEEALHRLGELRAVSWRAAGNEQWLDLFAKEDYQIALDVSAAGKPQPHVVRFGPPTSEGHRYAAVMLDEGQWLIFLFPGPLFADVLRVLSIAETAIP